MERWAASHHGSPDGYLPSPLTFAAAVAARTKRIALYVAAVIAPLHDPLRLAEDAAVVDLLAGGRLQGTHQLAPIALPARPLSACRHARELR